MEQEKKRILTIPEWHNMALQGIAPPMRIPIHGNSMFPLIRMDRDYVTIHPLNGMPEVGDIVLFDDPPRGRYVLHRVWKIDNDHILTWGDNCFQPDGWLPLEAIWGKAVMIERGKRQIRPDPKKGLLLAKIWHPVGKAYRRNLPRVQKIWHRIKRLWQ